MNNIQFERISFYEEKRVGFIELNYPEKRNALDRQTFDELLFILNMVPEKNIRALILRGAGEDFCAGFNLKLAVKEHNFFEILVKSLSESVRAIRSIHVPVIAAVHGAAIAGGCALAMSADHIIASKNSVFGYPVHRIGLSPAVTIGILESRVANGFLHKLLLSGEIIDSDQALEMGLIDEIVLNEHELMERSLELAESMASYPSSALKSTYEWLNYLDKTDTDWVKKGEKGSLESCQGSWISDRLKSFLEKK